MVMLKKSIKLFGRSVPISVIVLVLAVIGVAAAFLLNYNFTGTVSAASAPIIAYPAGGWQCSIVGLGTVVSCTGTPGATWEVSGIRRQCIDPSAHIRKQWKLPGQLQRTQPAFEPTHPGPVHKLDSTTGGRRNPSYNHTLCLRWSDRRRSAELSADELYPITVTLRQ